MILTRKRVAAAFAATAALAVGVPVTGASAQALPAAPGLWTAGLPTGIGQDAAACGSAVTDGQGQTAGNETKVCLGSGLSFVGPAIGQVATVMGPTIIGPATIGASAVSAGNVAIVP